jgi:hypothetical protein
MGGIVSSSRKKELEREQELKKMIAARLALFNKPPEPEDSDEEDYANTIHNSEDRDIKQLTLTENNVKVNSRKIKKSDAKETPTAAGNIDGPSHILDSRMMKVLEFMLDPDFSKVKSRYL